MNTPDAALMADDPAVTEQQLLERCEALVARATGRGADQAEAFAVARRNIAVRYEKGDLQLTQVDEGLSLGLRVFQGTRQGFASTNQAHPGALETAVDDALTLAGFSPPDPANRLPDARPITKLESLVEPALAGLGVGETVDRARQLVAATQAVDGRISIDQASVEVGSTSVAVVSSSGVAAAESDALLSQLLFGMAIDGDDVGGFDYRGDCVRLLPQAEAATAEVVAEFTANVLGNLGAGAAKSYRGPVLFAPAAFAEVFIDPLLLASSAIAVQRGRSAMAGKQGQLVASPVLHVDDDPGDRELIGAASFDREGQPCSRRPIVQGGVHAGLLYNGYAARVDGVASTGHALGGARSVPGLGPHAVVVGPGTGGGRQELLAALGRGLLVQRFSGTVDPASGDFSGVAKSARWVERGEVTRPVRETLISGNAFQLLSSLMALSSHTERGSGGARLPWALVDGVSVTAG